MQRSRPGAKPGRTDKTPRALRGARRRDRCRRVGRRRSAASGRCATDRVAQVPGRGHRAGVRRAALHDRQPGKDDELGLGRRDDGPRIPGVHAATALEALGAGDQSEVLPKCRQVRLFQRRWAVACRHEDQIRRLSAGARRIAGSRMAVCERDPHDGKLADERRRGRPVRPGGGQPIREQYQ